MSKEDEAAYSEDDGSKPELKVTTPDEAFIKSEGHSLNGLKLEPYTPERMWAADAMGLRWGYLSKAASKQYASKGTYPGMEGDVGIVIWLCSVTDVEEVRAARRNPDRAEPEAVKFAVANKLVSAKQKNFWDAYDVFKKIMDEVHASYGEPIGAGSEKKTQEKKAP
jgi:hypothetical protein